MFIWFFGGNVGRKGAIALVGGCSVRLSQAAIGLFHGFGNQQPTITDS